MTTHDWELWAWWSTTRGTPPIPAQWEDLTAFLDDIPCAPTTAARRISTIRAAHLRARSRIAGEPEKPDPPTLFDPATVGEVLHTIPVHGFPHGFRGRRDAFIIVATSLGMSARKVAALRPADVSTYPVPAINGRDLAYDPNHGLRCPACALTRWLRALSAWHAQLHEGHWHALELLIEKTPADPRVHDCATEVPDGWQHTPWLIPAIDRTGTPDLQHPITQRTLTSVLRTRRESSNVAQQENHQNEDRFATTRPSSTPRDRHDELQAIGDALDRLDALIEVKTAEARVSLAHGLHRG